MKLVKKGTWVFFGLFLIASAYAGDMDQDLAEMSLEELLNINVSVETASKKSEGQKDAPGIISVVTAQEIQQFGGRNLKEVLNRVTSIYMLSTYFGFNNFASFRGDSQSNYDNHTLILINGRPIRDALFGGLSADIYTGFPINLIERLEVIRGPGSVLYGAGAYSGVINIITRNKDEGTKIQAGVGSFNDKKATVVHRGQGKDLNYVLAAGFNQTDGWDFEAFDEGNVARSFELPEKHVSINADVVYKDLSFTGLYQESSMIYWGTTPIGSNGIERGTERYFGNLSWEKKLSDAWDVEVNVTYNNIEADPEDGDTYVKEMLYEVTTYYAPNDKLNVLLGATTNNAEGQWLNPGPLVPAFKNTDSSGYFQVDYTTQGWIKWIAGGQLNKPDGQPSDFVPRFGTVMHLKDGQALKLLYGKAFRSPASNEKHFNTTVILGNPDLEPEKVTTTELQYMVQRSSWWLNATAFHIQQASLIGRKRNPNPESFLIYDNLGDGTFNGLELEGKFVKSEKLAFNFGYTYQQNKNDAGQDDFTLMPNHLLKVGVFMKLAPWASLSVFDNYTGGAPDISEINPNNRQYNPPADATHLVSANLNIDMNSLFDLGAKDFTFSLYGYNLLDEGVYINEFSRRNINTMPMDSGLALNASLKLKF